MKIEIQDLFQDWEEQELKLERTVDTEAVLRRTMEKIGRNPMKTRKIGRILLTAACLLLFITTVAAVWRAARYREVDSVTITLGAEARDKFQRDCNAVITFEPQEPPTKPNVMGFTLSWLPEHAAEFMDGVTLKGRLEQIGGETELDSALLEAAKTNVQYVVGEFRTGQVINVDLYPSGEVTGRMFVPWGEATLVKEGMFLDMEALWLTTVMKDVESHYLLLYHADHNCVIKIGTSESPHGDPFKELERIAEGLTLIDSGVPSVDTNPDWNWIHLGVGLG